jgi:transcriptional regulator of acetoin/glycerol metabolism
MAAPGTSKGEDHVIKQATHVERVIESLTSGSAAARSRLAASWQRSYLKHGIDPAKPRRPAVLNMVRLKDQRLALGNVLSIAAPRLDDLYSMIGHCGCGILLTDSEGLVIDGRFGDSDAGAFNEWGLNPGADWSEAAQGTNGIGTCLAERRPVTIHRDQHYLPHNIGMSCIDAPVFGPDATLVAALDVSSARADQTEGFNRLIEAMVVQVARQIEADLFRTAYAQHRIVLSGGDSVGAALLAVDQADIVVGASREARHRHGLETSGAIRPRPVTDLMGQEGSAGGLERAERAAVIHALTRSGGNASGAARALGLGRATLYRRMKRLGLGDLRLKLSRN